MHLSTNQPYKGRGSRTHFRSRDERRSGAAAAGLAERRAGFGEGAGFESSFSSSPRRPRVDLRAGLAAAGAGAGAAAVRRGRPLRAGAGAGADAAGEALRPPERPLDERRGAGAAALVQRSFWWTQRLAGCVRARARSRSEGPAAPHGCGPCSRARGRQAGPEVYARAPRRRRERGLEPCTFAEARAPLRQARRRGAAAALVAAPEVSAAASSLIRLVGT